MHEPAKLAVRRDSPQDTGFRQVHVFVDDRLIGTLDPGESAEAELTPGAHTLRVYNTLVAKSIEFSAADGQTITFRTGNKASGCLLAVAASFGIGVMGVFLEQIDS